MGWVNDFLGSSIGKKLLMATTGLLLCIYLVIHLLGNLTLFGGAAAFNQYVLALSSIKPLVRVIEVLLALLFLIHIFYSFRVTIENRKAAGERYTLQKSGEVSTFTSRFMPWSGVFVLIFLVIHLQTIWYRFQVSHEGGQFYQIVMSDDIGFGSLAFTLFYILALILLALHLRHGFQSAFQTFGIRYNKYSRLIEILAAIFWLLIPLGFLSIPIYFGLLKGGF